MYHNFDKILNILYVYKISQIYSNISTWCCDIQVSFTLSFVQDYYIVLHVCAQNVRISHHPFPGKSNIVFGF